MRFIKLGLISIVLLFIMATLFSLVIPSRVRISKAIDIQGDVPAIMAHIKDTSAWKSWHPAFIPNDSFYTSASTSIINGPSSDSSITMRVGWAGRENIVNGWNFYTYQQSNIVTVQWYMDFDLGWYPWKKFGSLFFEDTYGAMMEKGLRNLKRLTER